MRLQLCVVWVFRKINRHCFFPAFLLQCRNLCWLSSKTLEGGDICSMQYSMEHNLWFCGQRCVLQYTTRAVQRHILFTNRKSKVYIVCCAVRFGSQQWVYLLHLTKLLQTPEHTMKGVYDDTYSTYPNCTFCRMQIIIVKWLDLISQVAIFTRPNLNYKDMAEMCLGIIWSAYEKLTNSMGLATCLANST